MARRYSKCRTCGYCHRITVGRASLKRASRSSFAYDMGKLVYEKHVRLMTNVPFKLPLSLHRESEERHEFHDDMKAVVLDTKEAVAEIICAGG